MANLIPGRVIEPRERPPDLLRPVAGRDEDPLERADEVQRQALSRPQPREAPVFAERQHYAEGQRAGVVREHVDGGADVLAALGAESATH